MEQSTLQAVRQAELEAAQAESAAAKQCQELIDQAKHEGEQLVAQAVAQAKQQAASALEEAHKQAQQLQEQAQQQAQQEISALRAAAAAKQTQAQQMILSELV